MLPLSITGAEHVPIAALGHWYTVLLMVILRLRSYSIYFLQAFINYAKYLCSGISVATLKMLVDIRYYYIDAGYITTASGD